MDSPRQDELVDLHRAVLDVVLMAEQGPFPVPVITHVDLRNFKSIGKCSVDLNGLTVLVGPNGAGKSNFVDGIRFTSDALNSTLENAIRDRGGIREVRRRSRGHPNNFQVRLELNIAKDTTADYAYSVGVRSGGAIEVKRETCVLRYRGSKVVAFNRENGQVHVTPKVIPDLDVAPDMLALQVVGGTVYFRAVMQAIKGIGFYNLNPDRMRELQSPDPGEVLMVDGRNLASVVRVTAGRDPEIMHRITQYLEAVVPGMKSVESQPLGPKETLEFKQEVKGDPNPWSFYATNMSDGTLRALGVITAVLQRGSFGPGVRMVAIEEPEVAIHPGASLRLMDALVEASDERQVLITTHSPDLLGHPAITVESLLAVSASGGDTIVAPIEPAAREVLRESLFTPGELLRQFQLEPDEQAVAAIQGKLF